MNATTDIEVPVVVPSATRLPAAHRELVEFGSDGWLDAARAYLEPRIAQRRDQLAGERFVVNEIYTDAPPHLQRPDDVAAIVIAIEDGALMVDAGSRDDADMIIRADYTRSAVVRDGVYGDVRGRRERLLRELTHRHGDVFEAELRGSPTPPVSQVLEGLHDHLARRTQLSPDVDHRIRQLGLHGHADQLEQRGYTVLEGAFTDTVADEMREALLGLIEESRAANGGRGRAASMLLQRGPLWEEAALHPWVHTLAQHLVGLDCNLAQSIGFYKNTGDDTHTMHNDPPHPVPGTEAACFNTTCIWAFDDFTETSGPTVVVPGSHKYGRVPDADARDVAVPITMPKGSIAMWHGALWHGAAIRRDEGRRVSLHNTYNRNIVRTFDNYLHVDPDILERNPPALTTLCGLDDIYMKNSHAGPDYSRRL